MPGAFSRDSCVFFRLLMLLAVAGVATVGQTSLAQTSAQTSSNQPATTSAAEQSSFGQSSSGQSSSGQSSSTQSSSGQSLSGQSSSTQSLADIARENQEKKAAEEPTAPPRMITNADIPKNPEGYTGPPADEDQLPLQSSGNTAREAAQQRAAERAGAQWRQQITAQTNRVAMLETRIERLKAQIRVLDPNAADDYSSGTSYNGAQATQIRILKEMEANLSQQRQRLEEMQDAARRAGMHTTVYDP